MKSDIKNITKIALFAAVLCIFGPFTITLPVSPVPISLVNLVIYIFAALFGTKNSLLGFVVYLLLGCVGLPVFSKGNAGIGYAVGPTGGYLIGFFFCSLGTSIGYKIGEKFSDKQIIKIIILISGMAIGTIICYLFGTLWLSYVNNLDFDKALAAGVIPFIPGDIVKIIVSVILITSLKKRLKTL